MEFLPNDDKNILPTAGLSKLLNARFLLVMEHFHFAVLVLLLK